MKAAALALVLLTAAIPAHAEDAMTSAANAFYALAAPSNSGGGIPDAGMRLRLQPLLSPGLNKGLADAAAAEARFQAKNKNSPPLIEGSIFSSLFEGPTSWKVGACVGDGKTARCAISQTREDRGQKPVKWIDTLVLVNRDGWKVDDLAYDANFAFGNTGTLSEMLRMAQREAQ